MLMQWCCDSSIDCDLINLNSHTLCELFDPAYGLDYMWVSMHIIFMDSIVLGHKVDGLYWVRFSKLDAHRVHQM